LFRAFIVKIKCVKVRALFAKNKVRQSALLQLSAMFCDVIAFYKLESKCKRLL